MGCRAATAARRARGPRRSGGRRSPPREPDEVLVRRSSGGDHEAVAEPPPADRIGVGPAAGLNGKMPVWPSRPFQLGIAASRTSSTSAWSSVSVGPRPVTVVGGGEPVGAVMPCQPSGWTRSRASSIASISARQPAARSRPASAAALVRGRPWRTVPGRGRRSRRTRSSRTATRSRRTTTRQILPNSQLPRGGNAPASLGIDWRQAVSSTASAARRSRATVAARPIARRMPPRLFLVGCQGADEPRVGLRERPDSRRMRRQPGGGQHDPVRASVLGRRRRARRAAREHRPHEVRHRGRRHPARRASSVGACGPSSNRTL